MSDALVGGGVAHPEEGRQPAAALLERLGENLTHLLGVIDLREDLETRGPQGAM